MSENFSGPDWNLADKCKEKSELPGTMHTAVCHPFWEHDSMYKRKGLFEI